MIKKSKTEIIIEKVVEYQNDSKSYMLLLKILQVVLCLTHYQG